MTDQTQAIIVAPVAMQGYYLAPAAKLNAILEAYQLKKEFVEKVLRVGVDYGTIPGAGDKPALKKAGAEKLANLYSLAVEFDDITTVEDWSGDDHAGEPFFYYRVRAILYRTMGDGTRLRTGSADGSCNSWEKKYRYRNGERVCPNCGKPTIIKGKAEYGGGYVCFAKKGGCGSKYKDGDQAIEGQSVGQVKNPDVAELVNTVLKMAQKRALVAAVLITTGASDYFTQDIDDFVVDGEVVHHAPAQTEADHLNGLGYDTQQQAPAQQTEAQKKAAAKAAWEARAVLVANDADWKAYDELCKQAAEIGQPVYSPDKGCTVGELREAYRVLDEDLKAIMAARRAQQQAAQEEQQSEADVRDIDYRFHTGLNS